MDFILQAECMERVDDRVIVLPRRQFYNNKSLTTFSSVTVATMDIGFR